MSEGSPEKQVKKTDEQLKAEAETKKAEAAKKKAEKEAKEKAEAEAKELAKVEYKDHQEFCALKLTYENLKKEAQKKYSKKARMEELEKAVKSIKGKNGNFKKNQGLMKLCVMGEIVFLTQDYPNPKFLVDKFTKEQQTQYFK